MNEFQYQQAERIIVEQEIKGLAKRWNEVDNLKLRENITGEVEKLLSFYETQKQAKEYHLDRFERLKR